jgi:hypothetical protein
MFNLTSFDEIAEITGGIETTNPCMVARIRRTADGLNRHEIAARLADAITDAADAAHTRRWQEQAYGQASPDAIVDMEYHDDLVLAWTLVAAENQPMNLATLFAHDGSVH